MPLIKCMHIFCSQLDTWIQQWTCTSISEGKICPAVNCSQYLWRGKNKYQQSVFSDIICTISIISTFTTLFLKLANLMCESC